MWDGLLEELAGWMCWLVNFFISFAQQLLGIISNIMPTIEVPSSLSSGVIHEVLGGVAWFFPVYDLGICIGGWASVELTYIVVLPLYRAILDLL